MKYFLIFLSVCVITSCSTTEVANVSTKAVKTSGEFLFEGPNTLQGPSTLQVDELAAMVNVEPEQIGSIFLSSATLSFNPDSLRGNMESALVQWVSDELPLVSVATKSPLPSDGPIVMEANSEQDILPYLLDPTSTLVVDVNLVGDAEALDALVSFEFIINY